MSVCCNSVGGTMSLKVNGTIYHIRGSVTIMSTNIERESGSNLDGKGWTTSKFVLPSVEMTISDACGLSLEDLMNETCIDATIELDQVGRVYVLVQASITGRPSLDPESGEISGISLVAEAVRVINVEV